jgi:hypothetical protein
MTTGPYMVRRTKRVEIVRVLGPSHSITRGQGSRQADSGRPIPGAPLKAALEPSTRTNGKSVADTVGVNCRNQLRKLVNIAAAAET